MSRRWRDAARSLVLATLLLACERRDPPAVPTPAPDAAMVVSVDAGAPRSAEPPMPWADAIRFGRFAEAKDGIAALPAGEQAKPEVRLARARVLLATRDAAGALAALEKLDDELPLVRDLIAKTRAQAMFEVGPFDQAALFFGARRDVASLVQAAEAWEKAGDATKARAAWDRVVGAEKRGRALEEKARARRMQITRLKDGEPAAAADARWLTMNALEERTFSDAASLLEKLTPPMLLTADELIARSRVLADAGRTEEALRTLERAATRGSKPPTALDMCRARAEIYFKARTRYPEAALAYRTCAGMGGPHAAEDLFLSARSFDRADRTADAIPAFQAVIQRHPRTPWADQAEFHVARELALTGKWKDAAAALDDYVKHWPNGKERREAERYRALAHLVIRDDKRARKLLEDLSGGAEDAVAAARWTNLAALAALRDGDKLHALSRWAEVARVRPLSYPALVARARLAENGGTAPPAIEPPESGAIELPAIELPPPANMLHRIGFDAEAEDALREREAAVVAAAPSRGTDALCAAYALIDRAKRRYQVSLQIPVQAVATAPGGKNRGAWDCIFPRPYEGIVRLVAKEERLAPELLWSVMRQESAFDPEVVSPARAVGLMQLLPETARATAKGSADYDDAKLTSPATSVALGGAYLRELLDKLSGQEALAVAAYNAGPEAIQRWLSRSKAGSLDVFIELIPFLETRGYVVRVLGNLARYGYLERGEGGVPALALDLK